jgi:hypothetical protein
MKLKQRSVASFWEYEDELSILKKPGNIFIVQMSDGDLGISRIL